MKNVLLDKGIILPSGEISKDKVNLVTGAITQPFAEMVILSILVDTFISKISLTMQPGPKIDSISGA